MKTGRVISSATVKERASTRSLTLPLLILLFAASAAAQTPTLVTGTVKDVNGVPYANARVTAQLIPSTASPTVIGFDGNPHQIGGLNAGSADVNGNFTMNLFCNSAGGGCGVISPSGTQWQFTVTTNGAPPPLGTGPQACSATLTITGASQSISSSFSACPALSNAGGGIASVSSLPPCSTPGTIISLVNAAPNSTATGDYYCGGYPAAQQPSDKTQDVSPLSYGAKADVRYIYDLTTTGTTAGTCGNSDCGFVSTETGKIAFGTQYGVAAPIGGGTLTVAQTTITVVSANAVTFGVTSVACTPSGTQICTLVWGTQDDTTALNNATAAAWTTNGVCRSVRLPDGLMFISSDVLFGPNTAPCSPQPGIDTTQIGASAYGSGAGNSVLVPLPSFTFPCTHGNSGHICIGGMPNLWIHDMGVMGFGQNLSTIASTNILFSALGSSPACTGASIYNVALSAWGWAMTGATTFGLSFGSGCGDIMAYNVVVEDFGPVNCNFLNNSNTTTIIGFECFGTSSGSGSLLITSGGGVLSTFSDFFGLTVGGGPVALVGGAGSATGMWNSWGDWFNSVNSSNGTTVIQVNTGANPYLINLTNDFLGLPGNAGTSQILTVNGSADTVVLTGNIINASGTNNRIFNVAAGNTIIDKGNTYIAGPVASVMNGSFIADGHSVEGICTGAMTASSTLGLYGTGPNATTTTCTSTTIGSGIVVEGARTLQAMVCTVGGAATTTTTCTVLVNGVGSTSTCSITAGNTTCTDFIHQVALANGALVSEEIISGAATTPTGGQMIASWN